MGTSIDSGINPYKSAYNNGKQEGRREVVEEISLYGQALTLKELQETVQWQAKLKEWRL